MDYLSLATGIFCSAAGLFSLTILILQLTSSHQVGTITRTAALGRGSLSLALLLLGANSILRYYTIGNSALSLVAIFFSLTALVLFLRLPIEQRNHNL